MGTQRSHRFVLSASISAVLLLACGDDDEGTATTMSSTSSTASTIEQPTTTTAVPTSTTTSAPKLPAPSRVVARTGAGSGEVEFEWSAVAGATGYRVVRAVTTGGVYVTVAEIDIQTGKATVADDVPNVYSRAHTYVPDRGPLTAPDSSDQFLLVDLGEQPRCFRVFALTSGEPGTSSETACGSPP